MSGELRPGLLKDLRHQVATAIGAAKAYEVPALCRRYGLADGDDQEAFASKFRYVHTRLLAVTGEAVVLIARQVAQEEGDAEELERLLAEFDVGEPAVPSPAMAALRPRAARPYYSVRTGKNPSGGKISFETLRSLYRSEIQRWDDRGYLQEHFGYWCIDSGDVPGRLGSDVGARMLFSLNKEGLWPLHERIDEYTEDDLFDVIEFVFDHISKPLQGQMHSWNGCGMHWETFDQVEGQAEYWSMLNQLLSKYGDGYELTSAGEVLARAPDGVAPLLDAPVPSDDPNVNKRVASAVSKFRRRHATPDDRRDAVRDLADVLEYLRPQLSSVMTKKDDGDLFNIANNFGVRHHRAGQQTDYDQAIWLSWMFYFYLATIHAGIRFIDKSRAGEA